MRFAVTGGRDYFNANVIRNALMEIDIDWVDYVGFGLLALMSLVVIVGTLIVLLCYA